MQQIAAIETGKAAAALARRARKAGHGPKIAAALLVLPRRLFVLVAFAAPIGAMLMRGVADPEVAPVLPRTLAALERWDGQALPDEAAFAALVEDLRAARAAGTLPMAAGRLNHDIAGLRTTLIGSARRLAAPFEGSAREAVLRAEPAWGQVETWGALARARGPWTDFFLLAALDLKRDAAGTINQVGEEQAVFRTIFVRTFWIAAMVTAVTLVAGYPLAALIALARPSVSSVLLFMVLLPFWTSLLVRTAAWMVLLAREGVVNHGLVALGLFGAPQQLLFNRFAVVIAMVHILLPFMILPLYAVMRQIPPIHLRAALSLGAHPAAAFRRVWLPQTLPGIGAGCLMVFIQALGFYITPALLGGGADQMLPYFIGFYANQTVNWGLASALSLLLLAATLLIVGLYGRLVGFGAVKTA
jgi:putative spermidine/putrescine transport system permease protein